MACSGVTSHRKYIMPLREYDRYLSGHHRGGHAVARRALVDDRRGASGSTVTWTRWTAVVERRTVCTAGVWTCAYVGGRLSGRRRRRQRWLSLKRSEACECCGSCGVRRYIYAARGRPALEHPDKSVPRLASVSCAAFRAAEEQ